MSLGVSDGFVVDNFTALDATDTYVCIGFVPRYVKATNGTQTDEVFNVTTTGIIQSYAGGDLLVYDGVTNNRWNLKSDGSDATGVYLTQAGDDIADQFITGTPEDGAQIRTPAGFILDSTAEIPGTGTGGATDYIAIR